MSKKGLLIVFSGPSGCGKGTVMAELFAGREDLVMSVSVTSRNPREGERDGVHYFFHTREEVEQMIAENRLLEFAEYSGNYYGTPLSFVEYHREQGHHVILEIEVQGALKVMERCPEAVTVFLLPPSQEELEHRLRGRGTETEEAIQKRLAAARRELGMMNRYQYLVVNDQVSKAAQEIASIIQAESIRTCRMEDIKEEFCYVETQ